MELNENKDYYQYKLIIEDAFWSICSNRKNIKLYKNHQDEDEYFEYKFIDKGLIV